MKAIILFMIGMVSIDAIKLVPKICEQTGKPPLPQRDCNGILNTPWYGLVWEKHAEYKA